MFRNSSHCSTSPPSHRRISTMSTQDLHKGTFTKKLQPTFGVHYSSLKHNHLYIRGIGTKPNHKLNHLYTRGTRHKAKPQCQLLLHKRDKTQSQSKEEITNLVITIDHKQHLVITIDYERYSSQNEIL